MEKKQALLGAHISISGGLHTAFERAQDLACTAMQIFTKSNRQWNARPLPEKEVAAFLQAQAESTVKSVVAHASYLINIGSRDHELRKKSSRALIQELERCDMLEIPFLIVHPGSFTTGTQEECLNTIVETVNHIFSQTTGKSRLLLETAAGQGSSVGKTLEELAFMLAGIEDKKRIGICVDTCHIFSAGYDIRTHATYTEFWEKFERVIGLSKLKALHLNDSKNELGARVDRHEAIGKGHLGREPFRLLMNDPRFDSIPKILETPKKDPEDDRINLTTLRSLVK